LHEKPLKTSKNCSGATVLVYRVKNLVGSDYESDEFEFINVTIPNGCACGDFGIYSSIRS